MSLSNFTSGGSDDTTGNGNVPVGPNGSNPFSGLISSAPDFSDSVEDVLINYNEKFKNAAPTLFRDTLIEQVLSVLIGKNKPNALLIGPAGVGKTKIAEDIARRICLGDALIPDQLKDHTVFELPLSNLVAGSGIVGMIEEKVKSIVDYATDPNNKIVLFIDEIHQLVGSRDSTYTKIAQILKPALARGDMQVIGATTTQEARSLDTDPAFKRRFSRLVVDELAPDQTLHVLEVVRPGLLGHFQHQITVSDDVLASVVTVADDDSHAGAHRPDSAITLLDRAMADRVLEQKRMITTALNNGDTATAQALQAIPNVPLTENRVRDVARRMLTGNAVAPGLDVNGLETSLKTCLNGQDAVLDQLIDRVARENLNVFPRSTPIAWLLAGASGVGKTQAAKIVAEEVTGQEPIILNMTEYHHESAISRIIGAPPGYVGSDSNAELPFDNLESNPHRVILLDELEKADRAVQRLFMQALDEGTLTTSQGREIDFSKAIVIATTNAAREALDGQRIGFGTGPATISHKSLTKALEQFFDAELLARFSMTVGFNPIGEDTYREILAGHYAGQRERILAAEPRLTQALPSVIPDDELHALTEISFVPSQGARPAQRAVRTWIEDRLLGAQAAQTAPVAQQAVADQEENEEPR